MKITSTCVWITAPPEELVSIVGNVQFGKKEYFLILDLNQQDLRWEIRNIFEYRTDVYGKKDKFESSMTENRKLKAVKGLLEDESVNAILSKNKKIKIKWTLSKHNYSIS